MAQLSPASMVGATENPVSGRMWRRDFAHGDFELIYRSHAQAPSEVERINAWLHDSGDDNRVTAKGLYGISLSSLSPGEKEKRESVETNEQRVARRAKQKLRWLIKSIGADRLLTLTFRGEVTDYIEANATLTKFLAICRREWGDEFKFAAVPEIQPRRLARTGVAVWHFHLALRGFWNIDKLRGFWWRAIGEKVAFSAEGKPVLLEVSETPGNVDITSPRVRGQVRRQWAIDRLAGYLAKYVGKSIGENNLQGHPSYRGTRGLHPELNRYVVRALTFLDVLEVFLASASSSDAAPYIFQSEDRAILWASGRLGPPRSQKLALPLLPL